MSPSPMQVSLILARRELRAVGPWALAGLLLAYTLWSVLALRGGPSGLESLSGADPVPLELGSWLKRSFIVGFLILPLWLIDRVSEDHRGRWFDPLFAGGWRRDQYLLTLFSVITLMGVGILLLVAALGILGSLAAGVAAPDQWLGKILAGGASSVAAASWGLLLGTFFRDRAAAIAWAVLSVLIPVSVSAYFVFRHDRFPPEALRFLTSFSLPPLGLNADPGSFLHKTAYILVAVGLSGLLAERLMGRHP